MKRGRGGPRRRWWVLTAALAAAGLLVADAQPAQASTGGSAHAHAVDAVVGDLEWEVTTEGAAGALSGLVDIVAGEAAIEGVQVSGVSATTPESPQGSDGHAIGPYEVGSVATFRQVNAHTERLEDAALSARSAVEGGSVQVFGTSVLDIQAVTASIAMAPEGPARLERDVAGLEVFGQHVGANPEVDTTRELTSSDVLEALEGQFPALGTVADLVGAVVTGGGSIRVVATGRDETTTDSAHAVGLHLAVSTDVTLRLCVPNGSGGCTGSVSVSAAATVLDATLAHVQVERPDEMPGIAAWQIVIGAAATLVLAGLLVWVIMQSTRRRREGNRP
ncbi:hypothetical protein [Ruania halotolerans]|uniref:hypothetical protein n=1 Tax=Ruania halotolerans TaxID=2897773 RepID=UPI001E49893D|nr:hypothetical protein [Ruania halotolerans]UFU05093.1 hypothetical protein LQF10_11480 [Ruania halotolerans]